MLTAKGIPFVYYGDEIGMGDLCTQHISQMKDVQGIMEYEKRLAEGFSEREALTFANEKSRDKSRSPMQWNQSPYAGFSSVEPWIAIQSEAQIINVELQQQNEESLYQYYKKLILLRKEEKALKYGNYTKLKQEGTIISFIREYENESILVVLNFGQELSEIPVPDEFEVILSSAKGRVCSHNTFKLDPHEAVIMKGANHYETN